MRIVLLSLGTRGDIQPFVALGRALQQIGHEVTVCTSASFAPWIEGHGLGYAPMNNDVIDLVNSEAGRRAMERSGGLPSCNWRPQALSTSVACAATFLDSGFVEITAWIATHPTRAGRTRVRQATDGAGITCGIAAAVLRDTAPDPLLLMSSEGS